MSARVPSRAVVQHVATGEASMVGGAHDIESHDTAPGGVAKKE